MMNSDNRYLQRSVLMAAGLAVMSFGIALSAKGGLGTTPIAAIPYVISEQTGASFGTFIFLFNLLFILLNLSLMRSSRNRLTLVQIPVLILYGLLVDVFSDILSSFSPNDYLESWIYTVVSIVILALGVTMMLLSNISMMPIDSFAHSLSKEKNIRFSTVKIIMDCSMIAVAAVLSLIFFSGQLIGVREGTIFAGIFTGVLIKCYLLAYKKMASGREDRAVTE